jgi:Ulp1 family protease
MSRGDQEKGAMAEAKPAEEENAPSEGPYQVNSMVVIVIISTTTTYYCHYDYYYNYYYQVEAADSESTKEQSCNDQFGKDLSQCMTSQSSKKENVNPNINTIDLDAAEDPISTDHSQIQYGTNLDSDVDHFFAIAKNHSQKQRVQSLSGTDLLLKDFQTLQPGEWLCDEIIDMYSNLLMMKLNRPSQFVIFSAQFSGLLSNGGKAYSYYRVSSFLNSKKQPPLTTKKQPPLTTLDTIYIPANVRNSHWFLVTLEHQKNKVSIFDSLESGSCNREKQTELLRRIIRYGKDTKLITDACEIVHCREIPQQHNSYDCGLFTINYLRALLFQKNFPDKYEYSRRHVAQAILSLTIDDKTN